MAQTDILTDGHGDSMTDPAQRAESVKILRNLERDPHFRIILSVFGKILSIRIDGMKKTF